MSDPKTLKELEDAVQIYRTSLMATLKKHEQQGRTVAPDCIVIGTGLALIAEILLKR